MWPLTPGLYSYMEQYYTSYGRVMAGLLLGSIPLVILSSSPAASSSKD